ncbi:MAG: hypothetical protein AB9835_14445 [Eubacteriales bacterium]
MDKLLAEVKAAIQAELNRATEANGATFHGPHEAYAIILEEVEEAQDEAKRFESHLDWYWRAVKWNKPTGTELEGMLEHATLAAAEWAQVAATCHKAMQSKSEVAQPDHEPDEYSYDGEGRKL